MKYNEILQEQERILREAGLNVGRSEAEKDCCYLLTEGGAALQSVHEHILQGLPFLLADDTRPDTPCC